MKPQNPEKEMNRKTAAVEQHIILAIGIFENNNNKKKTLVDGLKQQILGDSEERICEPEVTYEAVSHNGTQVEMRKVILRDQEFEMRWLNLYMVGE